MFMKSLSLESDLSSSMIEAIFFGKRKYLVPSRPLCQGHGDKNRSCVIHGHGVVWKNKANTYESRARLK